MTSPMATDSLDGAKAAQVVAEGEIQKRGPVLGASGLKHWAGYISEEFLPELRGERGVRVYDEMRRNEPIISGMLSAITSIFLRTDWDVKPDSKKGEDLAAARLIEEGMSSMRHPWEDHVSEASTFLPFGWSLFEIVYKQMTDGRILWDKLAFRGQDSVFQWLFDDVGEITAFVQRPAPDYNERVIPESKFVLYRTNKEKNNPEGVSILRAAYKPYYYKKVVEEIEAMGAERDLLGIPVIEAPWGATRDEIADAQTIVERIKNDDQSGLVLTAVGPNPEQRWHFKLVSGQGSSGKVSYTDRLITRYSREIGMTALAQFLNLGSNGTGSYALSSDQRDIFQIAVSGWMSRMVNTMNEVLVKRLLAMNGMTGKAKIVHGRISQLNLQTFTNFLTSGVQNGFITLTPKDEEWIRNEAEMPPLPEGTKTEPEKKEENAAKMAAQMASSGQGEPEESGMQDNSGLNKNPGENQNGIFGKTGDNAKGGDQLEAKPISKSRVLSEDEEDAAVWKAFDETLAGNLILDLD